MKNAERKDSGQGTGAISAGQIRMIYGIAGRHGCGDDWVHEMVNTYMYVDSLKELTKREACAFIDLLRYITGEANEIPSPWAAEATAPGWATQRQRDFIQALAAGLGMEEPGRLRRFLRARFGVDDIRFLTQKNASNVIEGLKAMTKRAREKAHADGQS